jgi:hypothetical protein
LVVLVGMFTSMRRFHIIFAQDEAASIRVTVTPSTTR